MPKPNNSPLLKMKFSESDVLQMKYNKNDTKAAFEFSTINNNSTKSNNVEEQLDDILDTLPRVSLKRRNSTGTIYVGTTMSSQDNEATIKCVCVVIRAHITEARKRKYPPPPVYDIFKDNSTSMVPSLDDIRDFFMLIFSKSQLESECIIMALIYCERIIKETDGQLYIRFDNWRSM